MITPHRVASALWLPAAAGLLTLGLLRPSGHGYSIAIVTFLTALIIGWTWTWTMRRLRLRAWRFGVIHDDQGSHAGLRTPWRGLIPWGSWAVHAISALILCFAVGVTIAEHDWTRLVIPVGALGIGLAELLPDFFRHLPRRTALGLSTTGVTVDGEHYAWDHIHLAEHPEKLTPRFWAGDAMVEFGTGNTKVDTEIFGVFEHYRARPEQRELLADETRALSAA